MGGETVYFEDDVDSPPALYPVWVRVTEMVANYVRRHSAESGIDYPLVYFVIGWLAQLASFGLAAVQRVISGAPWIAVLAGAIWLTHLVSHWERNTLGVLSFATTQIAATAILLLHPVDKDLAPIILIVATVMVSAVASFWVTGIVTVAALITLAVPTVAGTLPWGIPYMAGVAWGAVAGRMMLMQLRLLWQERDAREAHAGQAASDERRRIAREVHDVVAHSLSITLLHLTVARHALQNDRDDIDDALEALEDAERIGRQAMADIRLTVGLLSTGPSQPTAEPGIDDIAELVEDFRRAGLTIRYDLDGTAQSVSAATGLGFYRIAQESLANIAKHAPGAEVDVCIQITIESVVMCISNTAPHPVVLSDNGSGIRGMRQRAELLGGSLRAGPGPGGWLVRAEVPADDTVRARA